MEPHFGNETNLDLREKQSVFNMWHFKNLDAENNPHHTIGRLNIFVHADMIYCIDIIVERSSRLL